MKSRSNRGRKRIDPIAEFEALPDAEKERIWESFNREIPRSELRALTAAERKQWERVKRRMHQIGRDFPHL
jgi:hypothetical protein